MPHSRLDAFAKACSRLPGQRNGESASRKERQDVLPDELERVHFGYVGDEVFLYLVHDDKNPGSSLRRISPSAPASV